MKDHYSLKNIKKIKWGVLEENQPIHLYPIMYPGWCGIIKSTGKILGKFQKSVICLHRAEQGIIFIDHQEWTALGQFTLKKVLRNPNWGFKLNKLILEYSDELVRFAHHNIFTANLQEKANQELYQLYRGYDNRHSQLYNHAIIPVYLDLYKPRLTFYLVEYLARQVKRASYQRTAKECFTRLTVPDKLSKVQLEEMDLLNLADKIRRRFARKSFNKNYLPKDLLAAVNNHIARYKYLSYNFEGPAFSDNYFWKRLKAAVEDKVKPLEKIKKVIQEKQKAKKDYLKLTRDLKIDARHRKLLLITQDFIFSKDYRKMSLVQSYYEIETLLKEIGRRLNLTLNEVRNCLLTEIKLMLQGKSAKPNDLAKRMKGCLFVVINKKLPGRVFVDNRYSTMKKYLLKKEDLTEVNYFHGQTACLGKAEGIVKVINTVKDLKKMVKGDIMVSVQTNPNLLPAMRLAAAIITDDGGVTCHAAIVSRELKIPCVIGTKIATKVLKDGDKVAVDANRGEVRKI